MSFHLHCFCHTVKNKLKIKISNKFVPIVSLPNYKTIKLLPNQQLMFPHTNNSTANFCHKSVVQGGEQETEEKFNIK